MHLLMADGKQWVSAGPTVCMWRVSGGENSNCFHIKSPFDVRTEFGWREC